MQHEYLIPRRFATYWAAPKFHCRASWPFGVSSAWLVFFVPWRQIHCSPVFWPATGPFSYCVRLPMRVVPGPTCVSRPCASTPVKYVCSKSIKNNSTACKFVYPPFLDIHDTSASEYGKYATILHRLLFLLRTRTFTGQTQQKEECEIHF